MTLTETPTAQHPRSRALRFAAACLLLAILYLPAAAQAQFTPQFTAFKQAVAEAASEDEMLAAFYRERDFAPLWTSAEDAERRASFLASLSRASDHALPARRYDLDGLKADFHGVASERDRGLLEVRMSRTFLQYASDLHTGVLTPSRVLDTIKRQPPELDKAEMLARLGEGADPAAILRGVMPSAPEYSRLVRARMELQDQIARGGWGDPVPASRLDPGDTGSAVIALRDRLIAMGYMDRSAGASYDGMLQEAVQRFQRAHGLDEDGIAGERTLRAINVSARERLRSVIVALERERWLNLPRGERHIWVNMADFSSRIIDNHQITFETTSIIGERRTNLQTPEFSEDMTYMEINPDWTIPRSIIGRSYMAALQANPHAHGQLQVIDSQGRVVDRSRVNFAAYSARNLPFKLRQPPGPSNPLGKVKFMFPNPYAIYLHDTPERNLFNTSVLAHSNGCVRLEDPEEFAHILLAPQVEDPKAHFDRIHRSGQQTRVYLDTPVPTHLVYRTAFTDVRGKMNFRDDVYSRDEAVIEALLSAGVELNGLGS